MLGVSGLYVVFGPGAQWLLGDAPPSLYDVVAIRASCQDTEAAAHRWCTRPSRRTPAH